jgi:hypothetical protein
MQYDVKPEPIESESQKIDASTSGKEPRFVSMRWRFLKPLFLAVLIVAMIGGYVLAYHPR